MDTVISSLFDIRSIINDDLSYNIPRYQRLFVWEEEQVKTLFNDILVACQTNKAFYYIGGILVVKNPAMNNTFDLVDGQQRFTTLWLLSNELGGALKGFAHTKGGLRINFSIRKIVEKYFNNLSVDPDSEEGGAEFDDLVRLGKARKTLEGLILQNLQSSESRAEFIDFLLHRVKMVMTVVPPSTDLNKLFETLNNRGVQLEQHEILKAQLLSRISNRQKRYRYKRRSKWRSL